MVREQFFYAEAADHIIQPRGKHLNVCVLESSAGFQPVSNLLYRRFPIGSAWAQEDAVETSSDQQPGNAAVQPGGKVRYSILSNLKLAVSNKNSLARRQ